MPDAERVRIVCASLGSGGDGDESVRGERGSSGGTVAGGGTATEGGLNESWACPLCIKII